MDLFDKIELFEKVANVSEIDQIKQRVRRIGDIGHRMLAAFGKGEVMEPQKIADAFREIMALSGGINTYADQLEGYIEEVHREDDETSLPGMDAIAKDIRNRYSDAKYNHSGSSEYSAKLNDISEAIHTGDLRLADKLLESLGF